MVRLMMSNDEQTQKNNQKLDYKILNGIGDSDVHLVNPDVGGLMHNKLCIIDRLTVITGSYNWTFYADNKNHENIVIVQDREMAETCIQQFKEIVNHYLEVTPKSHYSSQQNKNQHKTQNNHQKEKVAKPQNANDKLADEYYIIATKCNKNEDYKLACEYYQKSAQLGNADAQYELGWIYFWYGDISGVEINEQKGLEWYIKSAKQGNAKAQCELGVMYLYGCVVEEDYAKAIELLAKSAEQSNAKAQSYFGHMYQRGLGVQKDDKKALEWYTKSAKQGHGRAQHVLKHDYGIII